MHDETMPQLLQNEARWDRLLRVAIGVALFGVGISGVFADPIGAALRIASIVPFATAALGWSPLYEAFGISTQRAERNQSANESGSTPPFSPGNRALSA